MNREEIIKKVQEVDFKKGNGLVPTIVQDINSNELWNKGATSGHLQYVKEIKIDCDNDTLLVLVEQVGAACHTGERSCFYRSL